MKQSLKEAHEQVKKASKQAKPDVGVEAALKAASAATKALEEEKGRHNIELTLFVHNPKNLKGESGLFLPCFNTMRQRPY